MKKGYSCIKKYPRYELNPIENFKRWKRNIKYIYQRVKYGYCDRDVWSIDYWFLNVVPSMLEDLRDNAHGCPPRGRLDAKILDGDDMGEWKKILSEMVFLFREANEETCLRLNSYEDEYQKARDEFEEKEKGLTKRDIFQNMPENKDIVDKYLDESHKITAYRAECKDKAFLLFAKYFFDLWD